MKIKANMVLIFLLALFMVWYAYSLFIIPSYQTSVRSGTVMTPNWWDSLHWIKENTSKCAVIATYWDPGHMISTVSRRAVVFDGASQGSKRTLVFEGNLTEAEIKQAAVISNYAVEKNGTHTKITTARIQDIATTLLTSNETKAVNIMEKYLPKNCSELYFVASADLVYKSQWWTYFSTWDPTKQGNCVMLENPKGDCYFYNTIPLSGVQQRGNATIYEYAMSSAQKFLIYQKPSGVEALLQQQNNFLKVKRIVFVDQEGLRFMNQENYKVDGTLIVTDFKSVYYIPQPLENSMFTKMFFFNGMGLEKFEMVGNWGGEIKLFRVKFD